MNDKVFKIKKEKIKQLIPNMGGCYATDRIVVDGEKVGYLYREAPDFKEDSGWRFLAGDESEDYLDNASNAGLYEVNTIANYDEAIIPLLETNEPCAFERVPGTDDFRKVGQ